jgi:hypothetical protein
MAALSVPMRVVLGLPFPTPLSRRLMLVHHTGWRTGRRYRQPVSYVAVGATLLTPGGGRWTNNLRNGQSVRLRLRGRDAAARPELVRDPEDIEQLLALMRSANPSLDRFVRIPRGADGRYEQARLQAAIDHGFCVVRWHLDAS